MACFLVSASEAVVVTAAQITVHVLEKKGKITYKEKDGITPVKWSKKLGILNGMLWGGSVLLALEHVFHGEVTVFPPFLTAMESAESTAEMLHEMGTVGVTMAALLTGVWAIGLVLFHFLRRRKVKTQDNLAKEGK